MLLFSNCLDRPGQWFIHPDTGSVIHRAPPDAEGMTTFTHYREGGPLEDRDLATTVHAAAVETWRWLLGHAPKIPVQFIERDIDRSLPLGILCESPERFDPLVGPVSWYVHPQPGFKVFGIDSVGIIVHPFMPDEMPCRDEIVNEILTRYHDLVRQHAAADSQSA